MNGIDTTVAWRVEAKRLVMELGPDGSIEKYRASFMARGLSQADGEDYDDIFAPVA